LVDDALDFQGNSSEIGKNVGDDIAEGKPTLPLIYALTQSNAAQAQLLSRSIEEGGLEQIEDIIAVVESSGAIQYTEQRAAQQVSLAIQALQVLPASPYKEALESLAEFAVQRHY